MDEIIKTICQSLKEEAEAVISYTEKIAAIATVEGGNKTAHAMEKIRLDEIEHIQNLCLELTKLMISGTEPPGTESKEA